VNRPPDGFTGVGFLKSPVAPPKSSLESNRDLAGVFGFDPAGFVVAGFAKKSSNSSSSKMDFPPALTGVAVFFAKN